MHISPRPPPIRRHSTQAASSPLARLFSLLLLRALCSPVGRKLCKLRHRPCIIPPRNRTGTQTSVDGLAAAAASQLAQMGWTRAVHSHSLPPELVDSASDQCKCMQGTGDVGHGVGVGALRLRGPMDEIF